MIRSRTRIKTIRNKRVMTMNQKQTVLLFASSSSYESRIQDYVRSVRFDRVTYKLITLTLLNLSTSPRGNVSSSSCRKC